MIEFKKLDHPVDEETFIEYLKDYNKYLKELIRAKNAGEDVRKQIDEEVQILIDAGIFNEDRTVNPMYAEDLAYMMAHRQ